MVNWQDLDDELEAWSDTGTKARFWWRDDDAIEVTPELERLVDLGNRFTVPLVLAVIPARLQPNLPEYLNTEPWVTVVQHGFAHENHAPSGEKSSEFPAIRSIDVMGSEITAGWSSLSAFGRVEKAFVPPWNRIFEPMPEILAAQGYSGVSTFGPRKRADGLFVNTHIDIIDWRGHRGFAGEDKVLEQTLSHLRGKRLGQFDASEPTGLLSHHLDHDGACWKYLETFLGWTRNHQAIEWLAGDQVFGP